MTTMVWDIETNGLPRDDVPDDHPAQPHPVQIAAILLNGGWRTVEELNLLVRPQGWAIPAAATHVHGISMEKALAEGVPEAEAIGRFLTLASRANVRVAHNALFDERIIRIALARLWQGWENQPVACTMNLTTELCALPPTEAMMATGRNWPKSPKLTESYEHLLGRPMPGQAHDAMSDCRAAAEVYAELARRGLTP
jgi:DNA polymerase-3 subunit epsilon